MKTKIVFLATAIAMTAGLAGAHAGVLFDSTFENVAGAPGNDQYTTVATADGWTGAANGIELQNNIAGAPEAPDGGKIFVELDTFANSSMSRTIADAGVYTMSYLYSPRPGNSIDSNGIEAFINGTPIAPGLVTEQGGSTTEWKTISTTFTATANSTLTFAAEGTSDSYGGYIDNITVSGAPEPATWALMLAGVGMVGFALRQAKRRPNAAIAAA